MQFKESPSNNEKKTEIEPPEAGLFTASVPYFNFRSSLIEVIKASNLSEDRQGYMLHNLGSVFAFLSHGFSLSSAEADFKDALKIDSINTEEKEILDFFTAELKDLYTKFRTMNPRDSE